MGLFEVGEGGGSFFRRGRWEGGQPLIIIISVSEADQPTMNVDREAS